MRFVELPLKGAFRVELDPKEDERGFFARVFCHEEFSRAGLVADFCQDSVSFNKRKGTLRGLHYQVAPHSETKLVRCISGSAFDVLVDLRRSSPTFGQWHAEKISVLNRAALYIPNGFAHGFQTLADATELYYSITPAYVPDASRGIAFDDPQLKIAWPVPSPIVSDADRSRPPLKDAEALF